jgi:PhzF family phenazine biosynthesis protein
MRLPIYQIDAFAGELFRGNPAAVCPVEEWLEDGVLQAIAAENNLSETAFIRRRGEEYDLRWFTPVTEVDLCGHATLASAFVVFQYLEPGWAAVRFRTRSGVLTVTREEELLTLDFPPLPAVPCEAPEALVRGLGTRPVEALKARDYMAVYEAEEEVRALRPDMEMLKRLDCLGVIATAPGRTVDFVSRFFAPGAGIPEDSVTGSAHCTLTPYWAERLGKSRLHAVQVSARGGELLCEVRGGRVFITGRGVRYLEGTIFVPG